MSGLIKRYYKLVDYKKDYLGRDVDLLTSNRDKAVEYYKNGGTVKVGYMQEYAGGRQYPWGKWQTYRPTTGTK